MCKEEAGVRTGRPENGGVQLGGAEQLRWAWSVQGGPRSVIQHHGRPITLQVPGTVVTALSRMPKSGPLKVYVINMLNCARRIQVIEVAINRVP